jgi:hypothetical protein
MEDETMTGSFRLSTFSALLAAAAVVALAQFASSPASADTTEEIVEASYLKDLDIRQVPMAELTLTPLSKPSSSSSALAVKTAVDRPDARYGHGDRLVLTVEVTEDAYVWVFDTGTSGKVHLVFPNKYVSDNFVRAGSPIAIPSQEADYELLVSHPAGVELLTVIASKDGTPLALDLIDQETQAGPFLALRGDAVTVAKDLSISLKKAHPSWVGHQQLIYIE